MKKRIAFGLGALSLSLLAGRLRRPRVADPPGLSAIVQQVERRLGVEEATRRYLLYIVLPLWMGAGLVDWYHHRKTKIEETSGTRESMIHALMMGEAALPVMLGLFLEVNPLIFLLSIGALVAHEATAVWDVAYAEDRREVTPNEQHTHSFLEVVPLMATSFLVCLYWDQFRALVGAGRRPASFALRPKRRPLSKGYVTGILAATVATIVLPYAEEFWRCYRVDRTLEAHPATRQVTYDAAADRSETDSGA